MKHCPNCDIEVRPIQDMQNNGSFADKCPKCQQWLGDRGNPMKDAAVQTRAARQAKREPSDRSQEYADELQREVMAEAPRYTPPAPKPHQERPVIIAHGVGDPPPVLAPITAAVLIAQAQDRIAVIDQELQRMSGLQAERVQLQRMIDAAKPAAPVVRLVENDHA